MVKIGPGIYRPFYPPTPQENEIFVHGFWLDKIPVTNEKFLEFVKKNPQWRKDKISKLFTDEHYLSSWKNPMKFGSPKDAKKPVVSVSWFAAKAYCEARGLRLPTENEWEFAASASDQAPDSRNDMEWRKQVLEWYTHPSQVLSDVGKNAPNYWGVHDLHRLIWEWVANFNSNLMSADPRENSDPKKNRFCGAGALAATHKDDYPSFMRIAFRSSLEAKYTVSNLGFRCARDDQKPLQTLPLKK